MPGLDDDAASLAKLARFDMEALQRSMQEAFLMLDNSRPSANGEHLILPDADFLIEPALATLRFDAAGVAIMQPVAPVAPAQHKEPERTAVPQPAHQGQSQARQIISPAPPQATQPVAGQAAAKPHNQTSAGEVVTAARSASPVTLRGASDAFSELTTLPTTDLLANKLGLLPHLDSSNLTLSPTPPRPAFASAFKQPSLWV